MYLMCIVCLISFVELWSQIHLIVPTSPITMVTTSCNFSIGSKLPMSKLDEICSGQALICLKDFGIPPNLFTKISTITDAIENMSTGSCCRIPSSTFWLVWVCPPDPSLSSLPSFDENVINCSSFRYYENFVTFPCKFPYRGYPSDDVSVDLCVSVTATAFAQHFIAPFAEILTVVNTKDNFSKDRAVHMDCEKVTYIYI